MRVVVIGASSGTGRQVVEQAVQRGHDVVALSRRGTGLPGITDVRGDATDPAVVGRALGAGADAVVLAIGGSPGTDRNRAAVTAALLEAAPPGSIGRVVVHSSLGVGDSAAHLPAPMRLLTSMVLRRALADHDEQERLVRESGLPWTIVRPGGLTDKPATGQVLALEGPGRFAPTIARADVAAFILDCLEQPGTAGHAYTLGTRA